MSTPGVQEQRVRRHCDDQITDEDALRCPINTPGVQEQQVDTAMNKPLRMKPIQEAFGPVYRVHQKECTHSHLLDVVVRHPSVRRRCTGQWLVPVRWCKCPLPEHDGTHLLYHD